MHSYTTVRRFSLHNLLLLLALLSLAGCGGGGGGDGGDTLIGNDIPIASDDSPTAGTNSWTVTASAGPGGSISPANLSVNEGDTASFIVTPDSGYSIASVTGCNGSLSGDTYTTGPVTADCTVTASFASGGTGNIWNISAAADPATGGTVSGTGGYAEGTKVTLTATPGSGYRFVKWTEGGSVVSTTPSYSFTAAMDRALVAHFASSAAAGEETPYTVDAFGYVDPRPESFHPLRRAQSPLMKLEELFVLSIGNSIFVDDWFIDDDGQAVQKPKRGLANRPGFHGTAARYRSAGRADVDGDGYDELIILRIGDPGDNEVDGLVLGVFSIASGNEAVPLATITDGTQLLYARLTAGDLDGDGADELIVYGVNGQDADNIAFSRIAVYDFNGTDFDRIFQWNINDTEVAVDAGDFDGDGRDELFAVFRSGEPAPSGNGFTAYILKRAATGLAAFLTMDLTSSLTQGGDYEVMELGAVAADLDNDGIHEPVVASIRRDTTSGTPEINMYAMKLGNWKLTAMTSSSQPLQTMEHSPYDDELWLVAAADLNGDGQDEIVSTLRDIDGDNGYRACRFSHFALNNDAAPKPFGTATSTVISSGSDATPRSRCAMAVLDNDRDNKDEVFLGRLDPGDPYRSTKLHNKLWRHEIDARPYAQEVGNSTKTFYAIKSRSLPMEHFDRYQTRPEPLSLVGGDFDGDSLVVRYTGNKWLSLPKPMVMFVAAAPPNQGNISHNFADTGTTITLIDSSSTSEGTGISVTTGVTLSVDTPTFFDVLSYSASVSLKNALTQTETNTKILTRETSFSGPPDADKVVFQGTLFMSYEYQIVGSSDPTLIGTRVTIDEPVSTQTWQWPLDLFNATVGAAHRIGPDIIDHTPGDVASYMRESDKNALQNSTGFLQTGVVSLNPSGGTKGGGYTSQSIETTEEWVRDVETTWSVEYALGVTVAGVGLTASQSLDNTGIYSLSLSKGIRYEGKVGEVLSLDEYKDYRFDWGMFIRQVEHDDGSKFLVIDYWVENLGPGYGTR